MMNRIFLFWQTYLLGIEQQTVMIQYSILCKMMEYKKCWYAACNYYICACSMLPVAKRWINMSSQIYKDSMYIVQYTISSVFMKKNKWHRRGLRKKKKIWIKFHFLRPFCKCTICSFSILLLLFFFFLYWSFVSVKNIKKKIYIASHFERQQSKRRNNQQKRKSSKQIIASHFFCIYQRNTNWHHSRLNFSFSKSMEEEKKNGTNQAKGKQTKKK